MRGIFIIYSFDRSMIFFSSINDSLSSKPDVNKFLNLLIRIKLIIIKESRKRGNKLSFQNDASFKKIF